MRGKQKCSQSFHAADKNTVGSNPSKFVMCQHAELMLQICCCAGRRAAVSMAFASRSYSELISSISPQLEQLLQTRVVFAGGFAVTRKPRGGRNADADGSSSDADDTDVVASVDTFDVNSGSHESLPAMPTPRAHCSTVVGGDHLFVIGGQGKVPRRAAVSWERPALNIVEMLDLRTLTWTKLPKMKEGRSQCAACTLHGRLYALGGFHISYGYRDDICVQLTSAEVLNSQARAWAPLPPMLEKRAWAACVQFSKRIFVFGGEGDGGSSVVLKTAECFDPADNVDTSSTNANRKVRLRCSRCGSTDFHYRRSVCWEEGETIGINRHIRYRGGEMDDASAAALAHTAKLVFCSQRRPQPLRVWRR